MRLPQTPKACSLHKAGIHTNNPEGEEEDVTDAEAVVAVAASSDTETTVAIGTQGTPSAE